LPAEELAKLDLRNLRELLLSYNQLGDDGVAAVFRNQSLFNLQHVEMQGTGAGPTTARAIAANPHMRRLKTLRLGDNLGMEGAKLICEAGHLSSLSAAHLGGIPPDG
jgi:hypothetical protein